MTNWYEVTAVLKRLLENGDEKTVKEKYLATAQSVSDAEATIYSLLEGAKELEISAAAQKPISEVFDDGAGDKWYKAKVMFIGIDEKTGAEKKTPVTMMVRGLDFENAYSAFKNGMRNSMADWELHTLSETSIVDVICERDEQPVE